MTKDRTGRLGGMNLSGRRVALILILLGLALVLAWVTIWAYRIYRPARSLLDRQAQAESLLEDGFSNMDPVEIEALVTGARSDIVSLSSALGPLVDLAPLFSWVPKLGPVFANAPAFMTMADAGSEAAVDLIADLGPALAIIKDSSTPDPKLPALLEILDNAEPGLTRASAAWDRFEAARTQVRETESLPWRIQSLVQQIDANSPAAQDALQLGAVLPELMGSDGPRTFLLIAQNEDELRPTGGFISGVGVLVVENGQIVSLDFADANVIDDWRSKPYDFPPAPLYAFMGAELFLFRDANFWPDFPRSAEQALQLYAYGQGVEADGVIAIDQKFVELLLGVLGPVYVPELEETVNAENVVNRMRAAWEPPQSDVSLAEWMATRKDFMGLLANAIRSQIQNELDSVNPIALLRTMNQAVDERHLQVYARDPDAAAVLARIGWDGRQRPPSSGDYLEVVDTSMGFNKVNAVVERTLNYAVSLHDDGSAEASLEVDYDHTAPVSDQPCRHVPDYNLELRYQDLTEGCYWNYVRVYVRGGSQLTGASEHPVPAVEMVSNRGWDGRARQLADEAEGLTVFANFVLLPPGQTARVSFKYSLPTSVLQVEDGKKVYTLTIRKQPGTESEQATVFVLLPDGASLVASEPQSTRIDGQELTFALNLRTDKKITVEYR